MLCALCFCVVFCEAKSCQVCGQQVRFRPFLHPEGSRQAQGGGTQRVPPRTESLGHRQTGSHASFGRRSSSSWEAETSSPNKRRRMDREQAVGVQHDPQYQARVTVRGQAIARDSSALSPGKVAKTSAGMPTESASSLKRKREEQPDEEAEMCPICEFPNMLPPEVVNVFAYLQLEPFIHTAYLPLCA